MSDFFTLLIVNGALCLLAVCSALTWTLILQKVWMHWRVSTENRRFAVFFWTTAEQASSVTFDSDLLAATGPKARVARAGTALSRASCAESGYAPSLLRGIGRIYWNAGCASKSSVSVGRLRVD